MSRKFQQFFAHFAAMIPVMRFKLRNKRRLVVVILGRNKIYHFAFIQSRIDFPSKPYLLGFG